jgi:hypothetical protein
LIFLNRKDNKKIELIIYQDNKKLEPRPGREGKPTNMSLALGVHFEDDVKCK